MRYRIAPVKNITRLSQALDALTNRAHGLPGMGLIWGITGGGKTTAAAWARNRVDGIYVRANALWTASTMMAALSRELNGPTAGSAHKMLDYVIEKLEARSRPVMVDEADYLVANKRLVEALRDLHDLSTAPVILIGMPGIERAIQRHKQLTGRLQQWLQFQPADVEDAGTLAQALCEVKVAPELLARLHAETKGAVRLIVVGLSQIEELGRTRALDVVTADDWGRRRFFFGEAPVDGAAPRRVA